MMTAVVIASKPISLRRPASISSTVCLHCQNADQAKIGRLSGPM